MKTIVNTAPEVEIAQTFPRLFSQVSSGEITVFATKTRGTRLTGDFAGCRVTTSGNVYNSAAWKLLPIGYSVTLIQE